MPDYLVANLWPFIINGPLWLTQVLLVVYGDNVTHNMRLIPGFSMLSVLMIVIPLMC